MRQWIRFFLRELSLALILISALYRALVSVPLGLDVYLLYLPGLCFAPLLVTLVLSYRWNSKLGILKLMLGIAVFFLWLCPVKMSGLIFSPAVGEHSLVTLNVQGYEADLGRLAGALNERNADVLCLQEVWSREQFVTLQEALSGYQLLLNEEDQREEHYFESGTVVAVRTGVDCEVLPSGRGFVVVRIEASQGPYVAASYHGRKTHKYDPLSLLQTARLQLEQSKTLLSVLSRAGLPALIGGDWNSPPSGPALKVLSSYQPAFLYVGRGLGATFPASRPLLRLDQVLGGGGVQFRKMGMFQAGSDHLGVRVEFSI